MSIMLPPDSQGNKQVAPGWRANDLTPDDIAGRLHNFVKYFSPGAPSECWIWSGTKAATGYGHFRGQDRPLLAHRVAWVAFTGRALTGQITIDHLCNVKLCVNPDHLEPVTLHENVRRKNDRRGYIPGGARARKEKRTTVVDGVIVERRPRRSPTPIVDEADYRCRTRASAKAYYEANREKVRAAAELRGAVPTTCPSCGLTLRHDGLRRHTRRTHPEAA